MKKFKNCIYLLIYICRKLSFKIRGNYGKIFLLQLITMGRTQLKQSTQNAKQIYETFIEQMKKYVLLKKRDSYIS